MRSFNIPYTEWDKIPVTGKGTRIGYIELCAYLEELQKIEEKLQKEAEEEAERKYRLKQQSIPIPQSPHIPHIPKSRSITKLTNFG